MISLQLTYNIEQTMKTINKIVNFVKVAENQSSIQKDLLLFEEKKALDST